MLNKEDAQPGSMIEWRSHSGDIMTGTVEYALQGGVKVRLQDHTYMIEWERVIQVLKLG